MICMAYQESLKLFYITSYAAIANWQTLEIGGKEISATAQKNVLKLSHKLPIL